MLDPNKVRNDYDAIKTGLLSRGADVAVLEDFVQKDTQWRDAIQTLEALQQERNKSIPKGKPSESERETLAQLSKEIKGHTSVVNELESAMRDAALQLPTVTLPDTPLGVSEDENIVISNNGTIPEFKFTPKSHEILGESNGLMLFEQAAELAGSRFVIMTGAGAKLERALYTVYVGYSH